MAYLEIYGESTANNIRLNPPAGLATTVELIGNRSRAEHVVAFGSSDVHILVTGNDCRVSGSDVESAVVAGISVTGLRAIITSVESRFGTTGCGLRIDGGADCLVSNFTSQSDENGVIIDGAIRWKLQNVHVQSSDTEGVIIDSSSEGTGDFTVYNAGRHGVRITDSSRNRLSGIIRDAGRDTTNTYDGVFVEGNSDRNRTSFFVTYGGSGNQARYGMNLSAGTVDGHIEASWLDAGATADFNDAGTGTVLTDDHIT